MKQSHATRSPKEDPPLVPVVDDNDDDLVLFQRAVQKLHYLGPIRYIQGGKEAIAYLAGNGGYEDRAEFPSPDFLILDLKMPGTNGFDVLTWLHDHETPPLPTVVLTSSDDERDMTHAYALGAASFLSKAVNFSEFQETIGVLLTSFGNHRHPADSAALQVA
jgi:CheY-like chemotaxis protein